MFRYVLAGIVLGAVLTAGLFLAVGANRRVDPQALRGASSPDAGPATDAAELDRLRKSLADSDSENAALRKELGSLKAAGNHAAALPERRATSLRQLGRRLLDSRRDPKRFWDEKLPETQDLMFDLLSALRDEARRLGVRTEELTFAPEGLPALAAEFLDSLEPPLEASQRARLNEVLAGLRTDWEAYAKQRGTLTRLEGSRELGRLQEHLETGIAGSLNADQAEAWSDLQGFWNKASPAYFECGAQTQVGVTPEEVLNDWTGTWSQGLGLDSSQAIALRPFIQDHIAELEKLHADLGMKGPMNKEQSEKVRDLVIRLQKRIAENLTLTERQAEALRNWELVEDFQPSRGR